MRSLMTGGYRTSNSLHSPCWMASWEMCEHALATLTAPAFLGNSAFRITPQLFELVNCCRTSVKWLRFGQAAVPERGK
jgi:hypothetical protein